MATAVASNSCLIVLGLFAHDASADYTTDVEDLISDYPDGPLSVAAVACFAIFANASSQALPLGIAVDPELNAVSIPLQLYYQERAPALSIWLPKTRSDIVKCAGLAVFTPDSVLRVFRRRSITSSGIPTCQELRVLASLIQSSGVEDCLALDVVHVPKAKALFVFDSRNSAAILSLRAARLEDGLLKLQKDAGRSDELEVLESVSFRAEMRRIITSAVQGSLERRKENYELFSNDQHDMECIENWVHCVSVPENIGSKASSFSVFSIAKRALEAVKNEDEQCTPDQGGMLGISIQDEFSPNHDALMHRAVLVRHILENLPADSDSLAKRVVEALRVVEEIMGFENAIMVHPAYSVDYDYISAIQLHITFVSKNVDGLYFEEQVCGTTRRALGMDMISLWRECSFIGTMINDLCTTTDRA
ncbi:flavin-dependent tRNA:m5U methyltransferase trmFO [Gracilaria domingensis]|nr:flavin-dependent tRNA:m5U methyltransferase trmFO [Gracilaria domingensis]